MSGQRSEFQTDAAQVERRGSAQVRGCAEGTRPCRRGDRGDPGRTVGPGAGRYPGRSPVDVARRLASDGARRSLFVAAEVGARKSVGSGRKGQSSGEMNTLL